MGAYILYEAIMIKLWPQDLVYSDYNYIPVCIIKMTYTVHANNVALSHLRSKESTGIHKTCTVSLLYFLIRDTSKGGSKSSKE